MSINYDAVDFLVTIKHCTTDDLFLNHDMVSRQFNLSFGESYYSLFQETLGTSFYVAIVAPTSDTNQLAAIFPFSDSQAVKMKWAGKIHNETTEWAEKLITLKEVVVMDFSSVTPAWRGTAVKCFKAVSHALYAYGYRIGMTEVQWLRQTLLWLRNGWSPIIPLEIDLKQLFLSFGSAIRNNEPPEIHLRFGQKFIWHHETFYDHPQWNIVLEKPIYLYYYFNN